MLANASEKHHDAAEIMRSPALRSLARFTPPLVVADCHECANGVYLRTEAQRAVCACCGARCPADVLQALDALRAPQQRPAA